jgi:hypothetical protein
VNDESDDTGVRSLALPSGRHIEVKAATEGDYLTVRSPQGSCVLTVLITDAGPVLRFEAAALQVATSKAVEIACEDFRVTARRAVTLEGRDVDVQARLGGVRVRADDDIAIDGERVLLNSTEGPQQLSWEEFLERGRQGGEG